MSKNVNLLSKKVLIKDGYNDYFVIMKLVKKGRKELGDYNFIGSEARFFEDIPKPSDRFQMKNSGTEHQFKKETIIKTGEALEFEI